MIVGFPLYLLWLVSTVCDVSWFVSILVTLFSYLLISPYRLVDTHTHLFIFGYICRYVVIFVDMYWYLLIFVDMHSYLFVFEYICWYLLISVDMYWYLLIFVDMHSYLFIFEHIFWYVLISVDMYWYLLICTDSALQLVVPALPALGWKLLGAM